MNYFGASQETVHLYLDESSLKVARAKAVSGKKSIVGLYYKNIIGMPDTAIPEAIRAGMNAAGARTRQISVLLASKYIITKNIEVPSLDSKEIEDIVRLQAVRHTPYSKEEVVVGHINLEVVLERYTKALLVIASNESVRKKTDLVELAGYNVQSVHLVPEALSKSVSEALTLASDPTPVGFVYLDSQSTDLVILGRQKPFFIRSIPVGARHLKQDMTQNGAQLLEELKKTCEAYQSEDSGSIPKRFVFLGIDSPEQSILAKNFETEFKIQAELLPLAARLPVAEEARKRLFESNDVCFLDVIADGLFSENAAVDLIPEDLRIKKAFRTKGHEIFMAGTYVMIIFILSMGVFLTKIYFRNLYLGEIHRNFEIKKKEAEELVALSEQTRVIQEFASKKGRSLRALNELQKILPQEMYLGEIALGADERISIKGTSDFMSAVFAFVTEFENSPYFRSVTADYTKSRKENDKDVSDFGLSANLDDPNAPYVPEPTPKPEAADKKSEKEPDKKKEDKAPKAEEKKK